MTVLESPPTIMAVRKALLLLHLVILATSLTLDHLPHRGDERRTVHAFDDFFNDDDDDSGNEHDLDNDHGSMDLKRKADFIINEYGPSLVSKHRQNPDNYWGKSYHGLQNFREHVKRETKDTFKGKATQKELSDILKDDDSEKNTKPRDKKIPTTVKKGPPAAKRKRESSQEKETPLKTPHEDQEQADFQKWLRREYYRNMAKSFASMRKKRAMWSSSEEEEEMRKDRRSMSPNARASSSTSKQKRNDGFRQFEEVTNRLKEIEDAFLSDALKVVKSGEVDGKLKVRQRVSSDLNAAYNIETMRAALFRLQDALYSMEEDEPENDDLLVPEFTAAYNKRKRGNQCPALKLLTSDCAALNDIVQDDALQDLLSHACNWHEVCYSCGEVFGLSSDNCDMGFIEQSRVICQGDVPCESTARLLLMPLRQRRVFYKRSNPSVCLLDSCVEEFLTSG